MISDRDERRGIHSEADAPLMTYIDPTSTSRIQLIHRDRRDADPIATDLRFQTSNWRRRTAPLLTLAVAERLSALTGARSVLADLSSGTLVPAPPTVTAVTAAITAPLATEGELLLPISGLRSARAALEAGSGVRAGCSYAVARRVPKVAVAP